MQETLIQVWECLTIVIQRKSYWKGIVNVEICWKNKIQEKNLDTEDNAEDEFQGQSTISGSISTIINKWFSVGNVWSWNLPRKCTWPRWCHHLNNVIIYIMSCHNVVIIFVMWLMSILQTRIHFCWHNRIWKIMSSAKFFCQGDFLAGFMLIPPIDLNIKFGHYLSL